MCNMLDGYTFEWNLNLTRDAQLSQPKTVTVEIVRAKSKFRDLDPTHFRNITLLQILPGWRSKIYYLSTHFRNTWRDGEAIPATGECAIFSSTSGSIPRAAADISWKFNSTWSRF